MLTFIYKGAIIKEQSKDSGLQTIELLLSKFLLALTYFMEGSTMVIKLKDLKEEGNFVSIPNAIAQDLTLSVHARATLLYMLSMPQDTHFTIFMLMNKLGFTDKRTKGTIKELVEKGYMKSIKIKDEKGKFIKFDYIVTPRPFQFSQVVEDFNACNEELPF